MQNNENLSKEIEVILNIKNDNAKTVIDIAEKWAKEFNEIPSSKMRDFYDYVLRIKENEENWYKDLVLLKPKLAYNYGKEPSKFDRRTRQETNKKKIALKLLMDRFSKLIDAINNDKEKFKNFKTFFEALVAYHKIYAKSQ
ncbi:CRISPR-associated protein, Csm2 family [Methanocaldococcus vulcanius M7]|uniref:CRISPR system Cms protein Csm2 n=1 Tax=Methanocaldococcus vulcanius (strain ATCC 700851 / DSM 12094 / M7) TaxID=579137 RepID=C9RHF4_METVM|nr:type III-A CRISPR-associated protein Csm2 [Methanocaldococcus vulcanius]ACX73006.1 CRISPR-associated protein, Csm2 family [Methanocaldococcus vulcanius M7]